MLSKCNLISAAAVILLLAGCRGVPFEAQILEYDGNKVAATYAFEGGSLEAEGAGRWDVDVQGKKAGSDATDYAVTFTMKDGALAAGGAAVEFTFDNWSTENYIFAPCYLYNGNRFKILPMGYPPFNYEKENRQPDMPITVTNVPHFNRDGSDATVDFRTNSCSTPLAGFYDKKAKRGFFILTEQNTELDNNAFFISEHPSDGMLTIRMSSPGVREHRYTMCNADRQSDDEGIALKAGDAIKMHFRVYDFPCEDLMAYFDRYLTIRKALSGQNEYRNLEPFSSIYNTVNAHLIDEKWYEDENFGYVCNKPKGDSYFGHMSVGWVGAPSLFLSQVDPGCPYNGEILRRFVRHMDSLLYTQRESGFFNAYMMKGEFLGDAFRECRTEPDVAITRRHGLVIYLGLQCFDILKLNGKGDIIKPEWEEMIRKACDAFCTLFDRYGELGQCVHAVTGEMHTPNSTAGALAIEALAYASVYFDEPRYLDFAERIGQSFYDRFLSQGYSGGSPSEILQCPDSESTAALVDGYASLFEVTRDSKWLKYSRDAAAFFSSWVVSYDYKFPESSGMARMGVKAAGSVWANVQNQHSAPGIYVMSGDFLLKIYRATGDKRYLELLKDMAHNVVQYVNTEGNRMQEHGGYGYVTERVNIGDWEGKDNIGGLADNDTNIDWEHVAMFKTLQNPGIYVQADKGELTVFDHVNARILSSDDTSVTLEITNPTYRDGDISVLAETSSYARANSLGWNAYYRWPRVHVAAGETVTVTLPVTDSVDLAADTEAVIAAAKAVTDSGLEVIYPCGGGGYPSFWIRDYAMGLDSMHNFSPESVKACYELIKSTVPTSGARAYWIPDHINLDGRPVWKAGTYEPDSDAGFGWRASLDGIGFLVKIAQKYVSMTGDKEFMANEIDFLKKGIDSIMHGDLVYVSPEKRSVVFGFEDTAVFDGYVAYASLQAFESYRILNEWAQKIGVDFDDPSERIKAAFNKAFVVKKSGMACVRPSTGVNKDRFDTWLTAYAVRSGILDSDTAVKCAKALFHYKDTYIRHGMAKHVPEEFYFAPGQMWELGNPDMDGTYQHGGYWSTPMADIVYAISLINPKEARALAKEALKYAHDLGYPEVVSETGKLQNTDYVSSVAYVYRAQLGDLAR